MSFWISDEKVKYLLSVHWLLPFTLSSHPSCNWMWTLRVCVRVYHSLGKKQYLICNTNWKQKHCEELADAVHSTMSSKPKSSRPTAKNQTHSSQESMATTRTAKQWNTIGQFAQNPSSHVPVINLTKKHLQICSILLGSVNIQHTAIHKTWNNLQSSDHRDAVMAKQCWVDVPKPL